MATETSQPFYNYLMCFYETRPSEYPARGRVRGGATPSSQSDAVNVTPSCLIFYRWLVGITIEWKDFSHFPLISGQGMFFYIQLYFFFGIHQGMLKFRVAGTTCNRHHMCTIEFQNGAPGARSRYSG